MKIPKEIRVGGIDYKIEHVKESLDGINSEAVYAGRVMFKEHKILLLDSYPSEKQFKTLLHEIIHIIDEDLKIGIDEENICRLETGLYQVLKDNKLLKEN